MRTLKFALVGAILGLVASAPAGAQPKYNRKTSEIKVKQTEATRKLEPKEKAKEEAAPPPEFTADQFFQIQGEVQSIRDEQIDEYKQLIRETPDDDPEKADLLFRLAELFAQKQRYYHYRAMEALTKAGTTKDRGKKASYEREHKKNLDLERKWLVEAVKIYKAIAENPRFRNYNRIDEALFFYAYTLQQAKYTDEARKIYKRIIKDYPNSKFIPFAYLAQAEYYFNNNDLVNAERDYDKVLKFPKSSVYSYALYMKGWVYYNQARPQDSLETWFKVAQLTEKDKKQSALNRQAKKDFVRAYADVGKPELAYKAFQRVDPDYAFKMLGFLGEFYLAQGKAEKTIYVFRQMIDLNSQEKKLDKAICEWQYTVVRAMLTIGTYEQKVKEVENLLKFYKFLADGNKIPPANLQECRDNAQATTGELAKIWHQEGLKTLNYETLGYVHKLYKLYMDYFPDAEDAAEMQFYFAELLWKRAEGEKNPSLASQRWEDAAAEYTRVLEHPKVDDKTKKEAAYALVLAWKNALAVDPGADKPDFEGKDADKAEKPEEIPDKQQKMLAAFDYYIKYVTDPKDDELTSIKFLKGRIYWRYRHYDKAIPYFQDVIKTRPDHETAEFSANLLLDSLNRSGRHDELIQWVDKLLAMKSFISEHEDLKANLELLKRQSMRKLAERHEKEGRFKDCGDTYLDIFSRYGEGEDLAEVLFNAGVCYERARLMGQAVRMREELTKRFPKSNLAQKAQYALGKNYADIAMYDLAAARYEEFAKKFGGEKEAPTALSNATFLRKGLGQDDKAIEDTNFFIKQYGAKKPKEAAAAHYSVADIYEKRKDYDDMIKHLQNYLKQWGKKGGIDRQIAAHVRIGEVLWRQSCPVKGVNGACIEIKRERALKTRGGKKKRSVTQTQCGPESKSKIIVHNRRPALVKEAMQNFNTAIKLWKNGAAKNEVPGDDDAEKAGRTAAMIYYVAMANFYKGEQQYEAFLSIKFPEDLDFTDTKPKRKQESIKKFEKWQKDKMKALEDTKKTYMHVVNDILGGGAAWAIASAARVGQLYQNISDALFTAPIPPIPSDIKQLGLSQDFVDAYCDALTDVATPLEEKSIEAFSFCLDKSTQLNWSNEWSRLCEAELAQIRPQDFPSAGEITAAATSVPMTLDVQPIATEIDSGRATQ